MEHKLLEKISHLKTRFPEDKFVLNDLHHDTIDKAEKAHWSFLTYIVPAWGLLFGYTALNGPLPVLRRQGRFIGTHRVLRQYAYLGLISAGFAYYPFYRTMTNTLHKLEVVEANKVAKDEGYIKPKVPIYYPSN